MTSVGSTTMNHPSGAAATPAAAESEKFIWVMDPMTRKLKVPISLVEPTQATAMVGTVPSLCMLFLDGRCRHPCCRQVHISLPVLQRLRKDAQQAPNCCGFHGDTRDNKMLTDKYSTVAIVTNSSQSSRGSPLPGPAIPPGGAPNNTNGTNSAHDSLNASSTTAPNLNGSTTSMPPQPQVLVQVGSEYIAMTVGLQRFLAQGRVGTNPFPHHHSNHNHSPTPSAAYPPGYRPPVADGPNEVEGAAGSSQTTDPRRQSPPPQDGTKGTLEIPLKMVCRLHLARKCRYLEDCNNVHICRELDSKLPPGAGGTALGPQHCSEVLQAVRPTSTTVNVGNTGYNVSVLAGGAVSDTDMHQLVTMHKQNFPQLQLRIVDVRSESTSASAASFSASLNANQGGPISPTPGPLPGYQPLGHNGSRTSPLAAGAGVSPQRRGMMPPPAGGY